MAIESGEIEICRHCVEHGCRSSPRIVVVKSALSFPHQTNFRVEGTEPFVFSTILAQRLRPSYVNSLRLVVPELIATSRLAPSHSNVRVNPSLTRLPLKSYVRLRLVPPLCEVISLTRLGVDVVLVNDG